LTQASEKKETYSPFVFKLSVQVHPRNALILKFVHSNLIQNSKFKIHFLLPPATLCLPALLRKALQAGVAMRAGPLEVATSLRSGEALRAGCV